MENTQRPSNARKSSDQATPLTSPDKPRTIAVDILRRVENGVFVDTLLDEARRSFDTRDSAFILELVNGTLRNRLRLDWVLDQFSAQPVEQTDVWTRNILRLAAYQMLFLDRVPVSASVNTATELAKHFGKKNGYVNGLLRNLDRKRDAIRMPDDSDPLKRLSILYSHPRWLVERWVSRFGADAAEALLAGNNRPAPLVVRTNTHRTTREQLKASLASEGIVTRETAYSPTGLEIESGTGIQKLSSYRDGWFIVQDQAAQLIGLMLGPKPGDAVLDACAAPGGKATHLAELMQDQGTVIALESDPLRLNRIRENKERLGLSIISPTKGDAAQFHEGSFDKILIDAPCSGLGVLRRHPDGRWNKTAGTIKEREALQGKILENCAGLLKPGGVLVYATCTTEPEENENTINAFLAKAGGVFALDDSRPYLPDPAAALVDEQGFFHTYPTSLEMDGFFGARIVRK